MQIMVYLSMGDVNTGQVDGAEEGHTQQDKIKPLRISFSFFWITGVYI